MSRDGYEPRRQKDIGLADQHITCGRQLTGGKWQHIHEESVTQNYTIGTRMVMDDRVFRYCYAKEALDALLGGRADVMPREGEGDAVAYEAGDYEVTIPMNALGDAGDYVLEQVADYWAEGYYWNGTGASAVGQLHRIKSSAAATTTGRITSLTGGFVTATLYDPIDTDLAASAWQTSWVNPYKTCKHEHNARMSVICQPLIDVTIAYYFWGQTWGPCFGQQSSTKLGLADGDRMCYFSSDGALMSSIDATYTTGSAHYQKAGFLITNTSAWTAAGGGSEAGGDQFYMLQLSP